jgi:ParB family chromosome partitioning protein
MRLLNLPKEAQDAISTGKISEAHGRTLLAVADPAQRHQLLKAIIEQGLTVRQAEEIARGSKASASTDPLAPKASGRPSNAASTTNHITLELSERLGTKVSLQPSAKGGKLVIEYYSVEELERIFESITSTSNQN